MNIHGRGLLLVLVFFMEEDLGKLGLDSENNPQASSGDFHEGQSEDPGRGAVSEEEEPGHPGHAVGNHCHIITNGPSEESLLP